MEDELNFESPEEAYAVMTELVRVTLTVAQSTQRIVDTLLHVVAVLTAANIAIVALVLFQRS